MLRWVALSYKVILSTAKIILIAIMQLMQMKPATFAHKLLDMFAVIRCQTVR